MKNIRVIGLILCVLICFQFLLVSALANEAEYDPSVSQGCNGIDSVVPYLGSDQKIANAEAIVLFENKTQTLMYAWNADKTMYPASLVKIMTALIAVENADMGDIVTVKSSTLDTIPSDATSVDLLPDEILTMEQLMYCLLVESANDAAAVIAEHIAGSQSAFVEMMNQYAIDLGCTGTNFTNVHGLHNDAQVTTARDMTRIMSAALKNELFCQFFSAVDYVVTATNKSEERELVSGNHMMHQGVYEIYYDARVTGGRTGVTTNGEHCLGTWAHSDDMDLICVVMGSESKYVDGTYIVDRIGAFGETSQLLDMGFQGVSTAQIFYDQQVLKQVPVLGGSSDVMIGPNISVSSVVPDGTTIDNISLRYSDQTLELEAPIEKGTHITDVEVWVGNVCVAYAELYAMNQVSEKGMNTIPIQHDEGGSAVGTILLIVLILVALLVAAIFTVRFINSRRLRKTRRRRGRK